MLIPKREPTRPLVLQIVTLFSCAASIHLAATMPSDTFCVRRWRSLLAIIDVICNECRLSHVALGRQQDDGILVTGIDWYNMRRTEKGIKIDGYTQDL